MSRVKITEHKAKSILHNALNIPYTGLSIGDNIHDIDFLSSEKEYVVKVDQGVKKRMKKGLVKLHVKKEEIRNVIWELKQKGYSNFIIEEFYPHPPETEKFMSMERTREGILLYYSNKGGIDVEENISEIRKTILNDVSREEVSNYLGIPQTFLVILEKIFDEYFFSFLEINPLIVSGERYAFLDLAGEVDSTSLFFVKGAWGEGDTVSGESKTKTPEEIIVHTLSAKSQAALSLEVLNPNGSIFVLLSGGGASVTLADEVYNLGYGKELANYGEYSGNPNAEETYLYTKQILSLLFKSSAPKKVLIIGGGVANFTDVRVTFRGVLRALDEDKEQLKSQGIKVFVRRGGPNQEKGLNMMKEFLEKEGLYGHVSGPELPLNEIVRLGIEVIK